MNEMSDKISNLRTNKTALNRGHFFQTLKLEKSILWIKSTVFIVLRYKNKGIVTGTFQKQYKFKVDEYA